MSYFKIPFCPLILNVIRALRQVIAHQAPLSMRFSGQEYWSRLPFPSPGYFPDSGIKPLSLASLVLAGRFFTTSGTWEASQQVRKYTKYKEGNNYQKSFTLRYLLLMFCHISSESLQSLPLLDIWGEYWNKDDVKLICYASGMPSWIFMQDLFSVLIIFYTYVAGAPR